MRSICEWPGSFPGRPFERFADDGLIHCRTLSEAEGILAALRVRMAEVGLELHPDKTKIVYGQDNNRRAEFPVVDFTFLGFTFRPRGAKDKNGAMITAFLPAISKQALKRLSRRVRSWRLHRRTSKQSADLARMVNPVVRGWMNYYGCFYRSALQSLLDRINTYLLGWIGRDETGPMATGRRSHATPDVLHSLDLGDPGQGEDRNARFRGSPGGGGEFLRATRLLDGETERREAVAAHELLRFKDEVRAHCDVPVIAHGAGDRPVPEVLDLPLTSDVEIRIIHSALNPHQHWKLKPLCAVVASDPEVELADEPLELPAGTVRQSVH
jgi:Group II intron, maturase-specific domain/Reverse transcriptase (RNA-dependent DNA polymerase)